jgi:hypothetical protein
MSLKLKDKFCYYNGVAMLKATAEVLKKGVQ